MEGEPQPSHQHHRKKAAAGPTGGWVGGVIQYVCVRPSEMKAAS